MSTMNKTEIKKILLDALMGFLALMPALVMLFTVPEVLISLWLTGLVVILYLVKKRQDLEIVESPKFQLICRLLYFQIITISFAFIFLPTLLSFIALVIVLCMMIGALGKKTRQKPLFIKWAKYVGFHVFNTLLLLTLLSFFPNIGEEEALFSLAIITFINSLYGVVYLKIESKIQRDKKLMALLIMVAIVVVMTMNLFPQAGDTTLFQQLFGG